MKFGRIAGAPALQGAVYAVLLPAPCTGRTIDCGKGWYGTVLKLSATGKRVRIDEDLHAPPASLLDLSLGHLRRADLVQRVVTQVALQSVDLEALSVLPGK